jgi:hypothetical protein
MKEWIDVIVSVHFNFNNSGNDIKVVLPFNSITELYVPEKGYSKSIRIVAGGEEVLIH